MTQRFSRRHFLSALAAVTAAPALAGAPAVSLRPVARGKDIVTRAVPAAERLVQAARLDGMVGFSVADVASGLVLEERNGAVGLPPASVAKALTAAYALDTLGPAHHFVTELIATGPIQNGVLRGDLVLAGGGDPTLDTDGLALLAERLKSAGVREVRGDFLVWGGAVPFEPVIDRKQPDHVGYNPAISGLNLNFNRVHFQWKRAGSGYAVTMDGRSGRYRPDVTMARMAIVDRKAPVYTYNDAGGRDDWTVAQWALGNSGARWLPVRQPELYAGEVFQTFAGAQGIRLGAPKKPGKRPEGQVVAQLDSAPLRIVLRDMLTYSTNITAELVGLAASLKRGRVTSLRGSAQAMNQWAGVKLGVESAALVDHSGLGDDSRISAAGMVRALVAVRKRMGVKPLLKPVTLRDAQGRPMKNHPLDVRAKTGTLNFVSGLAGFVDLPDGTELAFAIFAADTDRRDQLSRAERERPPGARDWNRRAKALQQDLLERWGLLYGA